MPDPVDAAQVIEGDPTQPGRAMDRCQDGLGQPERIHPANAGANQNGHQFGVAQLLGPPGRQPFARPLLDGQVRDAITRKPPIHFPLRRGRLSLFNRLYCRPPRVSTRRASCSGGCYNADPETAMRFPLDLSTLGNAFLFGTTLFGAFLVALWVSLVYWTYRDSRTRTQDRLLRVLAALLPLLLGPLGVLVYMVLRPPRTLDQAYQMTLEEEALLSEIEASHGLPWLRQPYCTGLAAVSSVSHAAPPPVQSLRKADGTLLEAVPVLRHAGAWHACRACSRERQTDRLICSPSVHKLAGRPMAPRFVIPFRCANRD